MKDARNFSEEVKESIAILEKWAKDTIEIELNKLYKRILAKKTVRICIYLTFAIFYPGIIIAISLTNIYGPENFSIFNNFISDLGSPHHTAVPYIFNSIAIVTSIILMPITLYLDEVLYSTPLQRKRGPKMRFLFKLSSNFAKLSFLLGSIGMLGVGIVNEDFSPNFIHGIFAGFSFGGFLAGGVSTGFIIVFKKSIIPKVIGYIMVFDVLGILILYLFINFPFITFPFVEWFIFLNIILWFCPITIVILRYQNQCLNACIEK